MADTNSTHEQLRTFRQQLACIEPLWSNWSSIESWIASVRPFLRRFFPDDLDDFNELAKPPQWLSLPGVGGPEGDRLAELADQEELWENNQRVKNAADRLLAFLDTLLQLSKEGDSVTQQGKENKMSSDPVPSLHFRPYKRRASQIVKPEELARHVQLSALDSGAEEAELEAMGGRNAVVASIRRHLPTFDPTEAQIPCGPAWMRLKPILVRAGLPVDEKTTLTDIKAFLDETDPAVTSSQTRASGKKEIAMPDTKNVFIIHGRNMAARDAMFEFLRATGLNPIEWGEAVKMTGKGSPYIGEVLDTAFANAQAVVALLTADDVACLRDELQQEHDLDYEKNPTPQARPNVLFEAGMAFGRYPDRTIIVEIGQLRPFSDVAGKHAVRFRGSPENRTELRDRLKTAGCAVKDAGTDWLKTGNFDEALRLAGPIAPKAARKNKS